MLDLLEPINVWTLFKGNTILPHAFFWRGRQIKVNSINLVHITKEGAATIYHFSVSSADNFYRLRFELSKLKWYLEQVEEDESYHSTHRL